MAQDKAAEIIDFTAPRAAAANSDDETTGAFLASTRLAAGLSIEEVSEAIKVKVAHLQALEAMRMEHLPPLPYTVGFVKAYARHLDLDVEAVAARFREEAAATAPVDTLYAPRELPAAGEGVRLASVFAIVAIVIFGIWVMMQIVGGGREGDAGDPAAPRVRLSDTPAAQPMPRPAHAARTEQPEEQAPAGGEASAAPVRIEGVEEEEPSTAQAPADVAAAGASEVQPARGAIEQSLALDNENEQAQDRLLPRRPQPPLPDPVIVEAELIRSSAPVYPERCARGAGAVESVSLAFDIGGDGRPTNTRVTSSTNSCFEAEALSTLSRWRFQPKTVNGTPAIDAGKSATLNFRR